MAFYIDECGEPTPDRFWGNVESDLLIQSSLNQRASAERECERGLSENTIELSGALTQGAGNQVADGQRGVANSGFWFVGMFYGFVQDLSQDEFFLTCSLIAW